MDPRWKILCVVAWMTFGCGLNYDIIGAVGAGRGDSIQNRFNTFDNSTSFDHKTVQGLYFCYSFSNLFFSIGAGVLIDRFGVRSTSVLFSLGAILFACGFALATQVRSVAALFIARILLGACNEAVVVCMGVWVARYFKGKTGMAFALGISQATQRTAAAIGFLTLPRIAESRGIVFALFVGAFACGFSAVAAIIVVLMDRHFHQNADAGQEQEGQLQQQKQKNNNKNSDDEQQQQQRVLGISSLCSNICTQFVNTIKSLGVKYAFLMAAAVSVYVVTLPFVGFGRVFFETLGLTPIAASSTMSLYQMLVAVLQPSWGLVLDRTGRLCYGNLVSTFVVLVFVALCLASSAFRIGDHNVEEETALPGMATSAFGILAVVVLSLGFSLCVQTTRPAIPLTVPASRIGAGTGGMASLVAGCTSIFRLIAGACMDSDTMAATAASNTTLTTNVTTKASATPLPSPAAFRIIFSILIAVVVGAIIFSICLNLIDAGLLCSVPATSVHVLSESAEQRKERQERVRDENRVLLPPRPGSGEKEEVEESEYAVSPATARIFNTAASSVSIASAANF